ncbi:Catalyzes late reaction in the cephamycin biosynthetic pathway [Fusarium albosuccineum]|uniref:Catalyzes late reaction in the cephamycin biosynthetic pathway n=1 Tax=Fusarium albosuccineum TaxID=1237068 RepID=A0A8H4PHR2_9HYPO|nr:Catalyzes late reaction in the cephamycin biosynthetic pathway [Fusarium albosuccineum]
MPDSSRADDSTAGGSFVHDAVELPQTLTNPEMRSLTMVHPSQEESDGSSAGISQGAVMSAASPFGQQDIPDHIDTTFDDWDMQLFDTDLALSQQDSGDTEPDTSPGSCESTHYLPLIRRVEFNQPKDQLNFHDPPIIFVRVENQTYQPGSLHFLQPAKKSSQQANVKLVAIQNHSAITSFRKAERALFFLKESISNCHGLVHCQSCRSPSRLMTFSILLTEKMIGVLEGIAAYWEAKADETHGSDPVLFGEYQINSTRERCEVLGFLILMQVKRLGALSGAFIHQAEKRDWSSQQAALRPIIIRMREAVAEMTTEMARSYRGGIPIPRSTDSGPIFPWQIEMTAVLESPVTVPRHVQSTINYYRDPGDGTPHPSVTARKRSTFNQPCVDQETLIRDITGEEEKFTLDKSAFQLCHHKTKMANFQDDDLIQKVYYEEVREFVQNITGATRVVIFDHTIRRPNPTAADPDEERRPVKRAHIDQSEWAAINQVNRHLGEDAPRLLKSRFQIINFWRPIKTIYRDPLAVCDADSCLDEDIMPIKLVHTDWVGEPCTILPNKNHRWYYKYAQTPEMVLLMKCYDSKKIGRLWRTPHCAFTDHEMNDREPRQSIEVRALVFHEDDMNS